jgi:hypothetical protein
MPKYPFRMAIIEVVWRDDLDPATIKQALADCRNTLAPHGQLEIKETPAEDARPLPPDAAKK